MTDVVDHYKKAVTEGKATGILQIDNDSLLFNKHDSFYTSGFFYTQQYTLHTDSTLTKYGWRLGQELYTASDIKLPPERIGPPDHPYAAWLFGGFFKEVHDASGRHQRTGIDIGCLGPCAGGEWTQTNLHRVIDQSLPKGWNKQVKNEPGILLYKEVAPVRWNPTKKVDITPSLKGRLGNIHTDVSAAFLVRGGQLNAVPDQPTFHGFFRVEGRAVAYDATLQGGYFSTDSPHTVKPKRFTGEAEAGVVWNREPFGLTFSVVRRGNEIRELQTSKGTQSFLRLQLSYTP